MLVSEIMTRKVTCVRPDKTLHEAAARGHQEVVAQLLERGADPNAFNRGATPLHGAVYCGQREVVALLLEQGADPNALVSVTDDLSATTLPAGDGFSTVVAPTYGQVVRGVSFTPGTR